MEQAAAELSQHPELDGEAGLNAARESLRFYRALPCMERSSFRLLDLQDAEKPMTLVVHAHDPRMRGLARMITSLLVYRLTSDDRLDENGNSVALHRLLLMTDVPVMAIRQAEPAFPLFQLSLAPSLFSLG